MAQKATVLLQAEAVRAFRNAEKLLAPGKKENLEAMAAQLKGIQVLLARCERGLGKSHADTLLLKGTEGSLRARLGDERRGYTTYVQAVGQLHRTATELAGTPDPNFADLIYRYETLASLVHLEGLQNQRWRDEALRVKLRKVSKPDPVLENDCISTISDAYGGWLSFRPPDVPRVLEFSEALCRLWLLRKDDRNLTETVVKQAITARVGVGGVWRLAARKGEETLNQCLEELLDRLDATTMLATYSATLEWASNLWDTPLWNAVDRLLTRMEAELERSLDKNGNPDRLKLADLAMVCKRIDRAADQLRWGLEERPSPRGEIEYFPAIFATPALLEDPNLREAMVKRIRQIVASPRDPNLRPNFEVWAQALEARGWWQEAEGLRRVRAEPPLMELFGVPPPESEDPLALGKLANNLFSQGKLDEAAEVCRRWRGRSGARLEADLLSARIEVRRGSPEVARDRARDVFQAMAKGNDDLWRMGGYSELWALFKDQPTDSELLAQVAAEAQRRIVPNDQVPEGLLNDPLRMIQALDPGLPESERSTTALDPLSRAALLMAKAKEGSTTERLARIEEALQLTEKALGPEHPALVRILEAWAKEDLSEDGIPVVVDPLRRAVAIAQAHPELGTDVYLRLKASLGFALTLSSDSDEGQKLLLETLWRYQDLKPNKGEDLYNDLEGFVNEITGFNLDRERYLQAATLLSVAQEIPFPKRLAAEQQKARETWAEQEKVARRTARVQALLKAEGIEAAPK